MSITPQQISIRRLCENFYTVLGRAGLVLTPKLEPTQGVFYACPHNRVFAATLRVLTNSTAESVDHQGLLIELRETIQTYIVKVEAASRLKAKTKGNPIVLDQTVLEKIFKRISELHTQVSSRDSSSCQDRRIEELIPKTEAEFLGLLTQVRGMATEWYFFKALDLCSKVITIAQTHRTQLLAHQYRFGLLQDGNTFLPPQNYFTAPWPVILLGYRLDSVINASPSNDDEYQRIIHRIVEAKKVFHDHEDILAGILLTAKFQETHKVARAMMGECRKTLAMMQERIPKAGLGIVLTELITNLGKIQLAIDRLEQECEACTSKAFPSDDVRFEVGERLDAQYSEILNQIGLFFSSAVTSFKETLPNLLTIYQKCLDTLTSYHTQHHVLHERHNQEKKLEFYPVLPAPIFRPNGFFSANISTIFPTGEQIGAFAPLSYSCRLDEIIQPHEQPRDEDRGFLPSNLQIQPVPPKPHHAKKHPHHAHQVLPLHRSPKEQGSEISPSAPSTSQVPPSPQQSSISPPIDELAQLSVHDERLRFRVGQGPDPSFQFSRHVRRWTIPELDPFKYDPEYRDRGFSPGAKDGIYFQHTPPLALIVLVRDYGEEFINIDGIHKSYFLPAEAIWRDGSGRYEKGVVALGMYCPTGEIIHYTFALKAPSTHRLYLNRKNFFQPYIDVLEREESSLELETKKVDPFKTLPSDKSVISQITVNDTIGFAEVTVTDPVRQIDFIVYFAIPE